jgi:hypothetical protein
MGRSVSVYAASRPAPPLHVFPHSRNGWRGSCSSLSSLSSNRTPAGVSKQNRTRNHEIPATCVGTRWQAVACPLDYCTMLNMLTTTCTADAILCLMTQVR